MNSSCDKKTCIISVVAVSIFLIGYGYLVHGVMLKPDYEATAHLWRTEAEMEAFFPWCMLFPIAIAAVLTCMFKKFQKGYAACKPEAEGAKCPIKCGGLCFGIKVGLLFGLLMSQAYLWNPIPLDLGIKWFFAGLFEGIGAGLVLGMVCGMSSKSCAVDNADESK